MAISRKVLLVSICLLLIPGLVFGLYWSVFRISLDSLDNLPKGDLLESYPSPDGQYTLNIYRTNGGATTDFAIRGEVIFNKLDRKPKNIYWEYHRDSADVHWVDNYTANINGHKLNVLKDEYDFRRD
ncbi:MAG: DUF5412 family protein [Chitinophagales bacterium]